MRKGFRVMLVAIEDVVDLQVACLGLTFAKQNGAIVKPTRIDGSSHRALLVFSNAEQGGVVVIGLYVAVAPDVVLVHPRASKNISVSYCRDSNCFSG